MKNKQLKKNKSHLQNQRGQGLIEYLIIVAIIAIGSMAVMRVVGNNLGVRFANIAKVLGGSTEGVRIQNVNASKVHQKDLTDFMDGAREDAHHDGRDSGE